MIYSSSFGQLVNVDHQLFYSDDGTVTGYPAGHSTYRIYAYLQDPADFLSSCYAAMGDLLNIGSSTNSIWNDPFGAITGDMLNPLLFGTFPSLPYDSFVTIGRADSSDPGAGITALSTNPVPAFQNSFDNVPGPNMNLIDGSWFTPNGNVNGNGVLQGDGSYRVLIAQITTDGEPQYVLNIQIFDEGDGVTGTMLYVGDSNTVDGSDIDGSCMGLQYPEPAECAGVPGCTDPLACNYDISATIDDGSCEYLTCAGCTDNLACNYDPSATIDDGSCDYLSCAGCTDPLACNFDPLATIDDGSCLTPGCIDPGACNYDAAAGCDDGSCTYPGCTDSLACNFDDNAACDDGSCSYPGGCCDDGDPVTANDMWDENCDCLGVILTPPPGPGFDLKNSSAVFQIDGFPPMTLSGPTIIERGECFINGDGLLEVPLEMQALCLEGSMPGLGLIRVTAGSNYGLPIASGRLTQQNAGDHFYPAESEWDITPKVEVSSMGSFCATESVQMEAADIIQIPPIGVDYIGAGGISTPVEFIDCCTGESIILFIHVSHTLEASLPQPTEQTCVISTITVGNEANLSGWASLSLVQPGNCEAVIASSGDIIVWGSQSASQTASELGNALAAALDAQPQCDIEVSVTDSVITIVQKQLGVLECCLKAIDVPDGVILGSAESVGQTFEKEEEIVTIPDPNCEPVIKGCMDNSACNFDPAATEDDGSCCFENCIEINLYDQGGDEWVNGLYEIVDVSTGDVVLSGSHSWGTWSKKTECLAPGCYYLELTGIDGDTESIKIDGPDQIVFSCQNGEQVNFSVGQADCFSCKDPFACNYDPLPWFDDLTCEYQSCQGCTNPESPEYDPTATIDDGSCTCDSSCPHDSNDDGEVNTLDLLNFLGVFGVLCDEPDID